MNNIAIIPARGGSKRIPLKNVKNFLGKPIISYSIDAALKSGLFNEVMVSTDNEEIANIALKFGAKVPFFRSKENSNDFATTFDVLEEVYKAYSSLGYNYEFICCIYPCAPFVSIENLKLAYELLNKNNLDSVFPVVPYSTPIQRALKFNNFKIEMINPELQSIRSQDLEEFFYDAGQFYWVNPKSLFPKKKLFTDNSGSIIIDETEAQDIDNNIDWKIAEIKYSLIKKHKHV